MKTILAIDDETSVLFWLEKVLKSEGYNFIGADSVQKALEVLKTSRPDMIILDAVMPGVGGVAFLKSITNSAGSMQYPVLILSGNPKYQDFFADMGVSGFLQKPSSTEILVAKIAEVIGGVRKGTGNAVPTKSSVIGKKVLLADDDTASSTIIGGMLTRAGFRVERTYSGADVLEKAVVFKPDLILMKRIMSGANGDRVASLLGVMPKLQDIPVVLYEEAGDEQTGSRLKERLRNVKGYLKDFSLDALIAEMRRVLGLN